MSSAFFDLVLNTQGIRHAGLETAHAENRDDIRERLPECSMAWSYNRFIETVSHFHHQYGGWPDEIHTTPGMYDLLRHYYDHADWVALQQVIRFVIIPDCSYEFRAMNAQGQCFTNPDDLGEANARGMVPFNAQIKAWLGVVPIHAKPWVAKLCSDCGMELGFSRQMTMPEATRCLKCQLENDASGAARTS